MPSLPDGIVIFVLALLLLGPKKLPSLARELGKWIGEFRRASNEFKMQMEEEMRVVDQADRQKEIAAITSSAPPTAALPGVPTTEPEHPHTDIIVPEAEAALEAAYTAPETLPPTDPEAHTEAYPIATSGELKMMPPATGLPSARSAPNTTIHAESETLTSFLDSIPAADPAAETSTHHG